MLDVLTTMGTAYYMMGDEKLSLQNLDKAEQMLGKDFSYRKQKRARLYLMKGAVFCQKGQYEDCDTHLDIAYRLFSEVGEDMGCAGVLIHRGIRYIESKEWMRARDILYEARAIFSRNPHKQYSYFALNEIATTERHLGEIRLSVDFYLQSLSGKLEIGDAHGTADTLLNLSEIIDYIEEPHKKELRRLLCIVDKRFASIFEHDTIELFLIDISSKPFNALALFISDIAIKMFTFLKSNKFLNKAQNVRKALSAKMHAMDSQCINENILDNAKLNESFLTLAEAGVHLQFSPATCGLKFIDQDTGECMLHSTAMSVSYHVGSNMIVETLAENATMVARTQIKSPEGFSGEEINFISTNCGIQFKISIKTYEKKTFAFIQIGIINNTSKTLQIDNINILKATALDGGNILPSSPPTQWSCFVSGFQSWSPTYTTTSNMHQVAAALGDIDHHKMGYNAYWDIKDVPREPGHYVSEMMTVISGREDNAILVGFIAGKRQFSYIELKIEPEKGFQYLKASCLCDSCLLEPSEEIESEPLMVSICGNGLEQLETWANLTHIEMSSKMTFEPESRIKRTH
jgi:tetratricopeptide (TPR) repeat protein